VLTKATPFVLVAALVAALAGASCAPFSAATPGADGGAEGGGPGNGDAAAATDATTACVAPTCADAGPSCRSYDFASSTCPSAWTFGGDPNGPSAVHECVNGKLHIAAKNTLDVTATLDRSTPQVPYSVRVSAKLAVANWDGGEVLTLQIGPDATFILSAKILASGFVSLILCPGAGANNRPCATFQTAKSEEHLVTFNVTSSGTTATIDCNDWTTLPATALPTGDQLSLAFGKVDGNPIDGTLDDVTVAFFDAP
jgi:hypothetical protein